MQLSKECRDRVIKQNPPTPTRPLRFRVKPPPGPSDYDTPTLLCNKGYSHIKRAPAYSFGQRLPSLEKHWSNPDAKLTDVYGMSKKGRYRIPYGIMSERTTLPSLSKQTPGPAAYIPEYSVSLKNSPAYSMQGRPLAYKEPTDTWTPSPNMYKPPILGKSIPAFSITERRDTLKKTDVLPGPTHYVADVNTIMRNGPQYSFGYRTKIIEIPALQPGPNAYCSKKFNVHKETPPAFSFGIKHSLYLGKFTPYLKQDTVEMQS